MRRNTRTGFIKNTSNGPTFVDNRWVSPSNAALLLRHRCHINVQKFNRATCFRYMLQDMCKGADKAMVSFTSYNASGDGFRMDARYNWVEDEHFQKIRIMTSPEAVCLILGFSF